MTACDLIHSFMPCTALSGRVAPLFLFPRRRPGLPFPNGSSGSRTRSILCMPPQTYSPVFCTFATVSTQCA